MEDNILTPLGCCKGEVGCAKPLCCETNEDAHFIINNANLNNSTIIGTTIINDCDPCIQVAVRVCIELCKGGKIIARTTTNSCGNYKFTGLTPGVYTIIGHRRCLCPVRKCIIISETDSIYMQHLLFERAPKKDCC